MTDAARIRLTKAALVAAGLFIGWRVLSLGAADEWAVSDPERALAWRADHPRALVRDATLRLDAGHTDAAIAEQARAALRANPLEGRAYRVLGRLAEAHGDEAAAARYFRIAAQRAPRDLVTHLWLARYDLRQHDPASALAQLDMYLRVEPEKFDAQYPLLQSLATFPTTRPAMVERLALDPPWRERFLVQLARQAPDVASIAPVFDGLRAPGGHWSRYEANAWLNRLVLERRWDEAYAAWRDWLPADARPAAPGLYNGGFEREPDGLGFGWRFNPVDGAEIHRDEVEGMGGEAALHVEFDNRRVPFQHVQQLMHLPPGAYTLTGRRRMGDLRNERGLQWRVRCADHYQVLGESDRWSGTSGWRDFVVNFTVPAGSCGGQWLELRLAARIPAEQLAGGEAWFDDLRLASGSADAAVAASGAALR